jgi:hypothetical protein
MDYSKTRMDVCSVCADKYTKYSRAKMECPHCDWECCVECFQNYLLTNNKSVGDCMSCHRELNLEFIQSKTNKTFHNGKYRQKRAEDLLSQEKSLLPDTQHLVERENRNERYKVELLGLNKELSAAMDKVKKIRNQMQVVRNRQYRDWWGSERTEEEQRKKFIMGCPGDGCRGFLSTAWKCGTCERYTCSECRVQKNGKDDPEHVCDPDMVASAKLIAQETKNCPKCAIPIYKIDGCDQMWCVECETPFSWRTGEIVTGVIHNPHFYQRQRDRNGGVAPRVHGDDPCAENNTMPGVTVVGRIICSRDDAKWKWMDCHRLVGHVMHVTMPQHAPRVGIRNNSDLRVRYLRNKLTEVEWLRTLKRR